jgi:hypothetical protein
MEPDGSLPHTQQLNTCLLLEPMYPVYALWFFSVITILILRSHLRLDLSRVSFPSGIPTKNERVFLFIPLQATNSPPPNFFLIWFDYPNIWRGMQISKRRIMEFSALSCSFFPLRLRISSSACRYYVVPAFSFSVKEEVSRL